jgi:hypothetical protein
MAERYPYRRACGPGSRQSGFARYMIMDRTRAGCLLRCRQAAAMLVAPAVRSRLIAQVAQRRHHGWSVSGADLGQVLAEG